MIKFGDFSARLSSVCPLVNSAVLLGSVFILAACSPPNWASGKPAQGQPSEVAKPVQGEERKALVAPPWASEWIGRKLPLSSSNPAECTGNLDGVRPSEQGAGRVVFGWGWDVAGKARIARIVVVDPAGNVVAVGEGGSPRGDVPQARPEVNDPNAGWNVEIGDLVGPLYAYGLLSDQGRPCRLGYLAE